MKLLLDECAPRRLRTHFPDHDIKTVADVGLNGLKNGQLLRAAVEKGFDALITVDQRLRFQQDLSQFNLAVLILLAHPCRYPQLKLLIPKLLKAVERIKPGESVVIQ
jgi:hypothetical protein